MVRFWSVLLALVVASLVAVNVSAQDQQKKKGKMDSGAQFDQLEKKVGHDTLKGELTKDEFVKALAGTPMADKAEQIFGHITKADEGKVTKDEYVAFRKQMHGKKKKADQ